MVRAKSGPLGVQPTSLRRVPEQFTADDARHWAVLTRAAFAARRAEIDALNVFPVPDGDTGTNLYLSLDAALDDVVAAHGAAGILGTATLVQECRSLARALLLAARGNSGVIFSQLVGGMCESVIEADAQALDAASLAAAFARGAATARRGVVEPKEGTILSVADAAAAAATAAAAESATLAEVAAAAVGAAHDALARTPEQLPALRQAGVVDAGGAGCVLMLESFHRVITGQWSQESSEGFTGGPALQHRSEWRTEPVGVSIVAPGGGHVVAQDYDGPAYEVMFLLDGTSAAHVEGLTSTLGAMGDSLLVVGGPELYNVHVHVDDAGAAVEAAIAAGHPHRIRITHLGQPEVDRAALGVVACAAGPGIAAVLAEAGAHVVTSAPGARASAGALLTAARATRARVVIVVPGDKDTLLAAEAAAKAAEAEGIETFVVPARTTVQGIAAVAVHDPSQSAQANVVAMSSAAAATRNGAVSVATKEALTWAGVCRPGDVLGIIDGDIAFLGSSLMDATVEVLDRLLAGGGELVTLVTGQDIDADHLAHVQEWLREERGELEVVTLDGGQAVYPLLIGVE